MEKGRERKKGERMGGRGARGRMGGEGKERGEGKGKEEGKGVSIRVSPEKSSPKGHWLLVSCPIVHGPPWQKPFGDLISINTFLIWNVT